MSLRRGTARVLAALVAGAVGVVLWAPPAAADPPKPSDYRSEVTAVTPETDTIRVEVVGGDSFIELTADPGTEVVVLGYNGEPYLRITADGVIERNVNSAATYLNEDRFGDVTVPPEVLEGGADLEPEWEQIGEGQSYAWHDHRMHWMAPDAPPGVPRGSSFDWTGDIGLVVDGEDVAVSGQITFEDSTPFVLWLGLAVLVAVAGWFAGRKAPPRVFGAVLVVESALALVVSWFTYADAPSGASASTVPLMLASIAVVAAIAGVVLTGAGAAIAQLASALALGGWALSRLDVLRYPVLPTTGPPVLDRLVTAVALGLAVAGTVVLVQSVSASWAVAADDEVAPGSA